MSYPWRRPQHAGLPSIEALSSLADHELRALMHSQLTPSSELTRQQWTAFWATLRGEDRLRTRAVLLLRGMRLETEAALATIAGEDSIAAEAGRGRRHLARLEEAESRLNNVRAPRTQPLAWAGKASRPYNAPARATIARLVSAIASHRAEIIRANGEISDWDRHLWSVLAAVELDPKDYS